MIPELSGRLLSDPNGYQIEVHCPFCGETHRHPAGETGKRAIGIRLAPCTSDRRYRIVAVEEYPAPNSPLVRGLEAPAFPQAPSPSGLQTADFDSLVEETDPLWDHPLYRELKAVQTQLALERPPGCPLYGTESLEERIHEAIRQNDQQAFYNALSVYQSHCRKLFAEFEAIRRQKLYQDAPASLCAQCGCNEFWKCKKTGQWICARCIPYEPYHKGHRAIAWHVVPIPSRKVEGDGKNRPSFVMPPWKRVTPLTPWEGSEGPPPAWWYEKWEDA